MGTHQELVAHEGGIYRQIYDIQTRIDEEMESEIMKDERSLTGPTGLKCLTGRGVGEAEG